MGNSLKMTTMKILSHTRTNRMLLLILILFSISVLSFGQNLRFRWPKEQEQRRDMRPAGFETKTVDGLFWNDSVYCKYCISESPMSYFEGYKEFEYPNSSLWHLQSMGDGPTFMRHSLSWAIFDSILYLCDVSYTMIEENLSEYEKRHLPLEELTGGKFTPPIFQAPDTLKNKINPNGVMQAQWFSDTLYIKPIKYCGINYGWLIEQKEKPYYYRLIFEEGKITEIEKTMVDDDNILVYPKPTVRHKVN